MYATWGEKLDVSKRWSQDAFTIVVKKEWLEAQYRHSGKRKHLLNRDWNQATLDICIHSLFGWEEFVATCVACAPANTEHECLLDTSQFCSPNPHTFRILLLTEKFFLYRQLHRHHEKTILSISRDVFARYARHCLPFGWREVIVQTDHFLITFRA